MHVVSSISVIIFATSCLIWIFAAVKDWSLNKTHFLTLILTILASILAFAYFYEPNGGDLSRHYELLDKLKQGSWKYAQNKSIYSSLFIYNMFAYVVAKNGNYALLQTIPLVIDFAVFLYIYLDVLKRNRGNASTISAKDSLFIFFLWICSFGLKLAVTGIRCVLAVALCALGIYEEYICRKNKIISIVLYLIALYVHNFTAWVIVVRLLIYVKKKGAMAMILFLVLLSGETVLQFLYDTFNNEYIRYVCSRVMDTFNEFQFGGEELQKSGTAFVIMWAGFVLMTGYLVYMARYVKKYYLQTVTLEKEEKQYCLHLFEFCYTVGCAGLPMAFNYLYMERFMYLVSWAFLMVAYYYLKTVRAQQKKQDSNFVIMSGMTLVCLFVIFFNDIYIFMVNYIGYYFLAM